MSHFAPLKNDTITVAPFSSVDAEGAQSYGSQQTVKVRKKNATEEDLSGDSNKLIVGHKYTTDEYVFSGDDRIWPPGANTADESEAYEPAEVGDDTTLGVTVSFAIL